MWNGTAAIENTMEVLQQMKTRIARWSRNSTWVCIQKNWKHDLRDLQSMFIAVLLWIAKRWKQPKYFFKSLLDQPGGYAELNKLVTKRQTLPDFTCIFTRQNAIFFPGSCLGGNKEWNQQMRVWSNQQSSFNKWKEKARTTSHEELQERRLSGLSAWGLYCLLRG